MPASMVAVTLRPLVPDDAQTIAAWGRDPEFRRAAHWSEQGTHRDRVSRLRALIEDPPSDLLRLGVQHGSLLVGYVDLHGARNDERELGFVVGDRSRWGRGLGFAAASAACAYGFEELRLTSITAEVAAANRRSVEILHRLGMREQGPMDSLGFRRFVLHQSGG